MQKFYSSEQIEQIVTSKMETWSDNKVAYIIDLLLRHGLYSDADHPAGEIETAINAVYHFGFRHGVEYCSRLAFDEWHEEMMGGMSA